MNADIQLIWQEIVADITSPAAIWQLLIIVAAVLFAWAVNGALRAYLLNTASQHVLPFLGGINRLLFPISALFAVLLARYALADWMHVGILQLASRLLLAMAAIRLMVYVLRYIFSPSGWLRAMEHAIAWGVWIVLALHLSGFLPKIATLLEDVQFSVGKNPVNLLIVLQGLLTVLVTIFIAMWLSRLLENKLMKAEQVSMNMRVVLVKVVRIAFIFFAVLIALSAVGLDITFLSVFGGAFGVGLGLGLQKIASNYVSGFIILLDKSMKIGDVLTVENQYGVVADLRSRYTVLRKLDGTQVVIPNETLIINSVINHSYSDRKVSVKIPIQVGYQTDLPFVLKLLTDIAKSHERTVKEPAPSTQISDFADSGINLVINVWIDNPEEGIQQLKTDIYLAAWNAFKEHGIEIPFPQREVRILAE